MTADVLAIILDVFSKILNTEVGPEDDFFSLGGDSLSSEIVLTEISCRIRIDLPGCILLDYARPIDLLAFITNRRL